MKNILVSGSSGFIGNNICRELIKLKKSVRGTVRNLNSLSINNNFETISVGNIGLHTDWKNALEDVNCIIHCAGRAHVMNKKDKLDTYHSVNIEGTKSFAEQAAKAGVKRFIFLSTVKVNGERTSQVQTNGTENKHYNTRFSYSDKPNPKDFYAISKFEAEKNLWEISTKTGLEVVIVRLPLVYGYGVKGNMARLMKLIKSGIPLPFALIQNRRSFIGIDNLVEMLLNCIENPDASGKTFLVSDGQDLSTSDFIKYTAQAMGHTARLFPAPISILKFASYIIGRQKEMDRLIESLQVDCGYTQKILNWSPSVSVEEGIKRMVHGR